MADISKLEQQESFADEWQIKENGLFGKYGLEVINYEVG